MYNVAPMHVSLHSFITTARGSKAGGLEAPGLPAGILVCPEAEAGADQQGIVERLQATDRDQPRARRCWRHWSQKATV